MDGGEPSEAEPARTLEEALLRTRFRVEAGRFALVGFSAAPGPEDLAALAPPAQLVREAEETTLLVREEALADLVARRPDARIERDLAWIRFETPMAWELVGFLARVTGALAAAGVPLGAVCGMSRDHLFLARRHLARAREALARIVPEAE
jgi:hypothetical protein